jgi:hypothetical protein
MDRHGSAAVGSDPAASDKSPLAEQAGVLQLHGFYPFLHYWASSLPE